MAKEQCVVCGVTSSLFSSDAYYDYKGSTYCDKCFKDFIKNAENSVTITTTNNIDGYKVEKYLDVISVEVVMGSGLFSEFGAGIADFIGGQATDFEKKLARGKKQAIKKLKFNAWELGGNAVIGVDIDYTEFSHNMMGIIVNGTVVEISKLDS